jgi:hypothetical protein
LPGKSGDFASYGSSQLYVVSIGLGSNPHVLTDNHHDIHGYRF